MTVVLAGEGDDLAEQLRDWIVSEQQNGARLFALEGLMSSGKTTIAQKLRASMPMLVRIELDNFHDPRGAHLRRTWDQAFDQAAAVHHVEVMLGHDRAVLIEGAICWPTAAMCAVPTRFIYLKRMQFPGFWADEHELTEALDADLVLRRSVRDYHAAERPWERADLVLERLRGADGQ